MTPGCRPDSPRRPPAAPCGVAHRRTLNVIAVAPRHHEEHAWRQLCRRNSLFSMFSGCKLPHRSRLRDKPRSPRAAAPAEQVQQDASAVLGPSAGMPSPGRFVADHELAQTLRISAHVSIPTRTLLKWWIHCGRSRTSFGQHRRLSDPLLAHGRTGRPEPKASFMPERAKPFPKPRRCRRTPPCAPIRGR